MAGLNFLPGATPSPEDQSSASALTPGQSAISTISLNLPRILGAKPLASSALMTPSGRSGQDANQIVMEALMRSSMSSPSPMGGEMSSPMGSMGNSDDELRKRLTELFGGITPTTTPPPTAPPPTMTPGGSMTPSFTPGSQTHQFNSPVALRPIGEQQNPMQQGRMRE